MGKRKYETSNNNKCDLTEKKENQYEVDKGNESYKKKQSLGKEKKREEPYDVSSSASESEDDNTTCPAEEAIESIIRHIGKESVEKMDSRKEQMQKLMKTFGESYNKTAEKENQESSKRTKLYTEYNDSFLSILRQWEADTAEVKKLETKIMDMANQQLKFLSHIRRAQKYRFDCIKMIHESCMERSTSLDSERAEKHMKAAKELNKEVKNVHDLLLAKAKKQGVQHIVRMLESILDET